MTVIDWWGSITFPASPPVHSVVSNTSNMTCSFPRKHTDLFSCCIPCWLMAAALFGLYFTSEGTLCCQRVSGLEWADRPYVRALWSCVQARHIWRDHPPCRHSAGPLCLAQRHNCEPKRSVCLPGKVSALSPLPATETQKCFNAHNGKGHLRRTAQAQSLRATMNQTKHVTPPLHPARIRTRYVYTWT